MACLQDREASKAAKKAADAAFFVCFLLKQGHGRIFRYSQI